MENTEQETQNNPASYRLSTMLPFDVFTDFVNFCKANSISGIGKVDFGTGLRILLMKSDYADRLYELETRMNQLESQSKETKPVEETESGMFKVKTFG